MEADVRLAFLQRPRLVDDEAGFLGIEVFDDTVDRTIFYLVTRWTDVESFRKWHRSEAHRMSHSGIPKGLRLDASFTKVLELDRLQPEPTARTLQLIAADYAPLMASFLAMSRQICLLLMDRNGVIVACNEAIELRLSATREQIVGSDLRRFLSVPHAALLGERLASGARSPNEQVAIGFVNGAMEPFTLRCHLDVQPDAAILIGEDLEAES